METTRTLNCAGRGASNQARDRTPSYLPWARPPLLYEQVKQSLAEEDQSGLQESS